MAGRSDLLRESSRNVRMKRTRKSGPSQAPGHDKAFRPSSAHAASLHCRHRQWLQTKLRRKQMSKHLRTVPGGLLYYLGSALPQRGTQKASVGHDSQKLQQKPCQDEASSALLRDDHIVLLAIDALLALHASFRKWRNRRKT